MSSSKRQRTHASQSPPDVGPSRATATTADVGGADDPDVLFHKMPVLPMSTPAPEKPPKGRKRFMADLNEMTFLTREGDYEVQGLRIQSTYLHCVVWS